ncbi:MAG: FxsA family protein [Gammaproteobacteria bacterium]
MPVFLVLLLLLIGIPLTELYVLIKVGRAIGAGTTIGLVILTAVLGAWLLRLQGLATLARVRSALEAGELPAIELVEGLILLFTAVLLLTPGFITDAIGFAVLLPGVRRALAKGLAAQLVVRSIRPGGPGGPAGHGGFGGGPRRGDEHTFEGDYRVEDDDAPPHRLPRDDDSGR